MNQRTAKLISKVSSLAGLPKKLLKRRWQEMSQAERGLARRTAIRDIQKARTPEL